MTILTKPFGDKKPEKLAVPLVGSTGEYYAPSDSATVDVDGDNRDIAVHVRHQPFLPTIFYLVTAIFVTTMGILSGVYIYRMYADTRVQRIRFHGFCGVPYDSSSIDNRAMALVNSRFRDDSDNIFIDPSADFIHQFRNEISKMTDDLNGNFFREEFELGLDDDDNYSKITVPDFRDGRRGRFLHDFKNNQSSIIDKDSDRCFVMPLDRDTVLPPQSLYDLVTKMWNGYYDIDTDIVRHDFRVVTPPVDDMTYISPRISTECRGMKVYMLEKYISGIYKRSVSLPDEGKYAEFSGKKIVEFDIVNIQELDDYEKKHGLTV